MPNIQNRNDNRFSRYDAMSTEDLQAFLREDASKPEGEESDIKAVENPMQRQFVAHYKNGDNFIRIRIIDYLDTHPTQVEQSDSLIEVYRSNGIDYYIFDNHDMLKAVWIRENFECYISGPISISEMKEIIDSIGER